MIRAVLLALLLPTAVLAEGEEIVSGLSQNRVEITANFDGSEILIYGAVKREAPAPTGAPLQVIITVEGPSTPLVIRRKERRAGIWVNTSSITGSSSGTTTSASAGTVAEEELSPPQAATSAAAASAARVERNNVIV